MFEIDTNARRLSQSEKQQYLEDGYVTGFQFSQRMPL